MRVYDFKGFPNPTRVRVALAEKNMLGEVEFISLDVPSGEHREDAFRAINPSATVPVLELDDGTCFSESSAIVRYIDALGDSGVLTGQTAKEQGVIASISRKIESTFLDAIADYFHFATPGLGPDIELYQNKDYGNRRKETALQAFAYLESLLSKAQYLAGGDLETDRFTDADITAYAGFIFAGFAGIDLDEAAYPRLAVWFRRISTRPAVLEAAA